MAFLFDQFPRSLDAFGRYRMSSPETIFDSKMIADNLPLFWDDAATSGGGTSSTFNTNQASVSLGVSNLTAGTRVRQTFRSFNYQPGKSQLFFLTFVLGAGAAGITKRVGSFDANNGLFLQLAASTLSIVRRTKTSGAVVDNVTAQANWNLDKLDGSGPSGGNPSSLNLDVTKSQILAIDYEWLGVGSVRFGFVLNGTIVYCHQINNANSLSLVYMSSPNLPLRYEISNSGAGPAATLTQICATAISEGGRQNSGIHLSINRGDTGLTTINNASLYPLVAIRLQSAYQFATVIARSLSVLCISTSSFQYQLLLNPTIVGTALSFTALTNSAIEYDVSRTNATTVTGGTLIESGYGQQASTGELNIGLESDLQIGASIAGVSDILVLAVARLTGTGTTETFYGALSWRESK